MTVSNTNSFTTYTGNGVTVAFPTGFPFFASTDLAITRITIADGTRTLLIQNVEYTVSGGGGASGTVTTIGAGSPLSALYQLEIKRATAMLQPLNLVANDAFPAEPAELAWDRLTMIAQEISAQIAAIVLGGSGAFTISNRPGPGQGLYSTQVGNDFQFKKINTAYVGTDPGGILAGYSGLAMNATTDEVALGVSGRMHIPTLATGFDLEPLRPYMPNVGEVWLWETGAGANAKYVGMIGGGGVWGVIPVDDTFNEGVGNIALLRSGANFTQFRVTDMPLFLSGTAYLDANAKRVGNIGPLDFDEVDDVDSGTTKTIDFSIAAYHKLRMTGNCTFTFTAPAGPAVVQIQLTQSTGAHTMTLPASVKWTSATVAGDKLLSTGAGQRDLLVLRWNGTDYLAQLFKNY